MKGKNTDLLFTFIISITALTFTSTDTAPVQQRSMTANYAHRYLKQYGYMSADNPTSNDVDEAMIFMQRFFGLSETGQLDQETMDMMSQPRCGVTDINPGITPGNCSSGTSCRRRRYTYLGKPWDSTSLTYRFNNYTPDLSRNKVQSAIKRALGVWAEVTPLSFQRKADGTSSATASNIEIVFGRGTHGINHPSDDPFDGPSNFGGTVLAHAFNPGTVLYPDLRGDMHFDEDERWQDAAGIDLFTVAAHEFGHSLGLGHSSVRGALMFPTYYGYNPNFRLHEDDIQGIQSLYGTAPSTQSPTTTPKVSTPKVTTPRVTETSTPSTTKPKATTPEVTEMSTSAMTTSMEGVDYCDTSYDTIATLYSVFYDVYTVAIKDQNFIRFASKDTILPDAFQYPEQSAFFAIWRASQEPLSVLLEKEDGSLVVIRENIYWEYDLSALSIKLKPKFPKVLKSLGLPENINITAGLHDRGGGNIFLFSETQYWSFDGNLNIVDLDSPRTIAEKWPGVPNDFNAAFSWQDNSCFVKGTQYWCFNERTSTVGPEFPRLFNEDFLGCDSVMSRSASVSSSKCRSGLLVTFLVGLVVILLSNYHLL